MKILIDTYFYVSYVVGGSNCNLNIVVWYTTQDGMLKHRSTYEIIPPEDIGYERSNDAGIVLGKLRYTMLLYGK